jgi:septum formation topological specificity factor MinE
MRNKRIEKDQEHTVVVLKKELLMIMIEFVFFSHRSLECNITGDNETVTLLKTFLLFDI